MAHSTILQRDSQLPWENCCCRPALLRWSSQNETQVFGKLRIGAQVPPGLRMLNNGEAENIRL